MIPALFTSSSALDASQAMISVVGNNLANSNTTGFKSQTLLFSNQFSQLLTNATQPTATNGGTDPVQVGMGVQVSATDTNESEGTFQSTGNPLDMAIQNSGYFVLKDGSETVFTRAGSFSVDSSGNLVDPSTGALVQRVGTVGEATATTPGFQIAGNNNISIPKDLTIPASPTQNITFTGNLSATATAPIAEVVTAAQALTSGGIAATANTALSSLDQTTGAGYVGGDVIDIKGTSVDGQTINTTYTMTGALGASSADTLGNLVTQINTAFQSGSPTGATATITSTGQIVLTANRPGASNMTLSLSNDNSGTGASGTTSTFANFVPTVVGAAGATATSTIQVYDAQGTAHNITFTFQKMAANDWNVSAAMNPADGTITGFGENGTVKGLSFNVNGSLASIAGTSSPQTLISDSPLTTIDSASGEIRAANSTDNLNTLDQISPTVNASVATPPADTITIAGTGANGAAIVPVSFPLVDNTTVPPTPATVQNLLDQINTAFTGTTTSSFASLDASGNIVITAPQNGQSQYSLNISDTAGSNFSKLIQMSPGSAGGSNMTFQLANLAGSAGPQTVSLNLGTPNGFSGVTQTGATTSVNASAQDGFAQGTLESTSVNTNGIITGLFTNGETENLAQIGLATFSNAQGLQNAGNNYFTNTTSSGLPTITTPGSGGAGTIESGGLEGSNVDVGTEFTQLIAAQQGYEVNAKAFSIANQLMQTADSLIQG